MAALLVALAVMAILMTVAMPTWRQAAQREREEELIFRGKQYARAVELFQRQYANTFPPNFDVLVEQHFLRKKYSDPMVDDGEFQPLYQVDMRQVAGGQGRGAGGQGRGGQASAAPGSSFSAGATAGQFGTTGPRGGVIGVVSKSKDKSIRLYNGRNYYNEWEFVYVPLSIGPGGTRGGAQRPGQRGDSGVGTGGFGGMGGRGQGGGRGMGPGGQRGPGSGQGPGGQRGPGGRFGPG